MSDYSWGTRINRALMKATMPRRAKSSSNINVDSQLGELEGKPRRKKKKKTQRKKKPKSTVVYWP